MIVLAVPVEQAPAELQPAAEASRGPGCSAAGIACCAQTISRRAPTRAISAAKVAEVAEQATDTRSPAW